MKASNQITDQQTLRDQLQSLVIADLLGPADGPEELVDERDVRGRYLVGLLAPKGQSALPEDDFEEQERVGEYDEDPQMAADGWEEGDGEGQPAQAAYTLLPSSLGLTFSVDPQATQLQISARWGQYKRVRLEEERFRNKDGSFRPVWQRHPHAGSTRLPLAEGRTELWTPDPETPDVYVQGLVRLRDDRWSVTLFLINGQREGAPKDEFWLFQPELAVDAPDDSPIFHRRPARARQEGPEQQSMAMLYRRRLEFAVGHGVAVHAAVDAAQPDRASRLTTVVVPTYDVAQSTPPTAEEIPALAGLALDMKILGSVEDGRFAEHLAGLPAAYRAWIDGLKARVEGVSRGDAETQSPSSLGDFAPLREDDLLGHLPAAERAIAACETTLERIQAGIDLLGRNPRAAQAFAFANRAMYLQRVHTRYAAAVRQGQTPDYAAIEGDPRNYTWRTFQLAFILLNLPGLADPTHPERSRLADLLWFPTGGGKTEAYLGVAAFALAIRRLQGEVGGRSGHAGITVLMRYTLRLLTLQQFQRAAALICACEVIRRNNPEVWGGEAFRIGLWVGRRTTPNRTADADEAIKRIRQGGPGGGEGTPHQLTNCPWCGNPLNPGKDIVVDAGGRGRTLIYCSDPLGHCPFSPRHSQEEGIPVLVVDEEIYRRLPSLLIATVDKFAQMPWNGRTAMLFGQVDGYCERHGFRSPEIEDADSHPANRRLGLPPARTLPMTPLRPPDLIIQDELHLISGPLGTLVGLYETAVDELMSWEVDGRRVRPKIIASTATIRQAGEQIHNLFDRQVNIFPPHGLDVEDNFFARQRPATPDVPGRRYLGICAPGIRHKTVLIRTYASYLAAAQKLYAEHGAAADPWMTLVGYFSSLRELGGMRRATDDSVNARLRRMEQRGLANRFLSPFGVKELTSRLGATDIPDILDQLETHFDPADDERPKGQRRERRPIDVLLATNMISVGVDINRLGLMVAAGQPKTTAEYIQATSRVGRSHPGLVCVVYNWTRPRDLSHYESFEHYHATFYQHVESLSVTPFSAGAMQRGLSALLVAYLRLAGMDFNPNRAAEELVRDHPLVAEALARIGQRAANVVGGDVPGQVRQALESRLDRWQATVAQTIGAHVGYRPEGGHTVGLLKAAGVGGWETFTCLNSLRNVEPSIHLILDNHGMDRVESRPWTFGGE